MTRYSGSIYWWRTSIGHTHFSNPSIVSGIALRSLINPILPDSTSLRLGLGKLLSYPSVVCFRDDDSPFSHSPLETESGDIFSLRRNYEMRYSPWGASMLKGLTREIRRSPTGGGNGGDDDGSAGGGGGGDGDGEDEEDYIFLLPVLTLAFAAFHLGYCIAVWFKDYHLENEFFRMGFGLFCLLVLTAIRLNKTMAKPAKCKWAASKDPRTEIKAPNPKAQRHKSGVKMSFSIEASRQVLMRMFLGLALL